MSREFLTNINLNKNELQNAAIQNLTTAPSSPVSGQIYFDLTLKTLRQWDGVKWLDYVTANGGNEYITSVGSNLDVTAQQLTLGNKVVITDSSQTLTNKTLGSGTSLSANLDANSNTIINLATPLSPGDAASKGYVDGVAQGLNVKESVLAATTENIALDGSVTIVDTVSLTGGNRVLVKNQSNAADNGIYIVNALGWTRAADQTAPEKGDYVFVESGSQVARGYIVTAADLLVGVVWTQFSAAGEYTAGQAIDITGTTISVARDSSGAVGLNSGSNGLTVNVDGSTVQISANALAVKVGTGLAVDTTGVTLDTTNGYGVRKYSASNGALTATSGSVTWTVTHNLGTKDVTVQLRDLATDAQVEVDVVHTSTNVVTLSWTSAGESANAYRVVVVG